MKNDGTHLCLLRLETGRRHHHPLVWQASALCLIGTYYPTLDLRISNMHRPNNHGGGVEAPQQQQPHHPEVLPPGVGRIPLWWMEITPHYVLDLEEEEYRRRAEEQMACYFAHMAAADDAGMLDAHGNPLLGPDGQPLTSSSAWGKNGWAGRSSNGGGGAPGSPGGPLGRNFVPGQVTPETLQLLGIDANNDPDYRSYLTGAKYPPGYWEKLAELGYTSGPGFSANNLAQTDYGRYGRQAEQPKHKPTWAKMKLRSTTHGQDIRHGIYDTSPKREGTRRVQEADLKLSMSSGGSSHRPAIAPPPLDDLQQPPPERRPVAAASRTPARTAPSSNPASPDGGAAGQPKTKKVIRKVRKVRRKRDPSEATTLAPAAATAPKPAAVTLSTFPVPNPVPRAPEPEPQPTPPSVRRYNHKDYYYNAPAQTTYAGTTKSYAERQQQPPHPEQAPAPPVPPSPASRPTPSYVERPLPPPPAPPAAPVPPSSSYVAPPPSSRPASIVVVPAAPSHEPSSYGDDDEDELEEVYEEEEIIEEVYEDDDDYEEVVEEEVVEEYEDDDEYSPEADIGDLQAILAAKQAELARLQAQLANG